MTSPDLIGRLTELRDGAQAEVERLNEAIRLAKGHKRPGRPVGSTKTKRAPVRRARRTARSGK